jgi:hypothetical protein
MGEVALLKIEKEEESLHKIELLLQEKTLKVIDLYLEAGPEHINKEIFSNTLNRVVDQFHLTPSELALSQYTKQSTISRWLSGGSAPTPIGRKAVFEYLSVYCAEKMQEQTAPH